MSTYEEKIKNMEVENFEVTAASSWESSWMLESTQDKKYTAEELLKLGLEFTKETKEMINIPFIYYLNEEEDIFVQICFTVKGNIDSAYAEWLYYDGADDLFEGHFDIADIEKVDYNGFCFYDIDKCIQRGIELIQQGVDYTML